MPSILVGLDREASGKSEPTAHGLLKSMKSYKFVATMYLLSDVLPHLSRLSKIFQKKESMLICLSLPANHNLAIAQYKHAPGPNISKVDEVLSGDLKDFEIETSSAKKASFKEEIQVKYIEAIVNQLQNHFPSVELLTAFSILIHK